jgi:hypothetical protein
MFQSKSAFSRLNSSSRLKDRPEKQEKTSESSSLLDSFRLNQMKVPGSIVAATVPTSPNRVAPLIQ